MGAAAASPAAGGGSGAPRRFLAKPSTLSPLHLAIPLLGVSPKAPSALSTKGLHTGVTVAFSWWPIFGSRRDVLPSVCVGCRVWCWPPGGCCSASKGVCPDTGRHTDEPPGHGAI